MMMYGIKCSSPNTSFSSDSTFNTSQVITYAKLGISYNLFILLFNKY